MTAKTLHAADEVRGASSLSEQHMRILDMHDSQRQMSAIVQLRHFRPNKGTCPLLSVFKEPGTRTCVLRNFRILLRPQHGFPLNGKPRAPSLSLLHGHNRKVMIWKQTPGSSARRLATLNGKRHHTRTPGYTQQTQVRTLYCPERNRTPEMGATEKTPAFTGFFSGTFLGTVLLLSP